MRDGRRLFGTCLMLAVIGACTDAPSESRDGGGAARCAELEQDAAQSSAELQQLQREAWERQEQLARMQITMQQYNEFMQAISNAMNSWHDAAMAAIRNIQRSSCGVFPDNSDLDGDGMPDSSDPDDDGDGMRIGRIGGTKHVEVAITRHSRWEPSRASAGPSRAQLGFERAASRCCNRGHASSGARTLAFADDSRSGRTLPVAV